MNVLVTGAAGFIGAALSKKLLKRGDVVTGLDNLNHYYDVDLKKARLEQIDSYENFQFTQVDIGDRAALSLVFSDHQFDTVVNLAAQAGVRYSIDNPAAYVDANLVGFANVLEGCRTSKVNHLVYASSSSVYGANKTIPFSEDHVVDHPLSLYGATKKANEVMAHAYAHLYKIPVTGLRFFTVYGPWGRPDMALFKFTRGVLNNQPIPVYNNGDMVRDFTFIDDVVEAMVRIIDKPLTLSTTRGGIASQASPLWRIYNIGNSRKVQLLDYIRALEKALGKKAILDFLPMQDGDVPVTEADVTALQKDFGYRPETNFEEGVQKFVDWYLKYFATTSKQLWDCFKVIQPEQSFIQLRGYEELLLNYFVQS